MDPFVPDTFFGLGVVRVATDHDARAVANLVLREPPAHIDREARTLVRGFFGRQDMAATRDNRSE